MYLLETPDDHTAILKIIGKFTDEDYAGVLPGLTGLIDRASSIRLLVDLSEFTGWQWQAAWDKSAFGFKYWGALSRFALIGDAAIHPLAVAAKENLKSAEIKIFSPADAGQARKWLSA